MSNVKVLIQFNATQMELPINPEEITISREADNEELDIIGLGKTVRKGEPGLVTTTIESFLPAKGSYFYNQGLNPSKYLTNGLIDKLSIGRLYRDIVSRDEPKSYISFLNLIWYTENRNNNVARIITTGLPINLNMLFVIENFEYDHKAGEEDDIYYKLEIKQYVPYGVKKLSDLTSGLYTTREYATFSPFINSFDINTYIVEDGDNLLSVTKKLIGDDSRWRELYEVNKSIIHTGYYMEVGIMNMLVPGTTLILPDNWSNDYNMIF